MLRGRNSPAKAVGIPGTTLTPRQDPAPVRTGRWMETTFSRPQGCHGNRAGVISGLPLSEPRGLSKAKTSLQHLPNPWPPNFPPIAAWRPCASDPTFLRGDWQAIKSPTHKACCRPPSPAACPAGHAFICLMHSTLLGLQGNSPPCSLAQLLA